MSTLSNIPDHKLIEYLNIIDSSSRPFFRSFQLISGNYVSGEELEEELEKRYQSVKEELNAHTLL